MSGAIFEISGSPAVRPTALDSPFAGSVFAAYSLRKLRSAYAGKAIQVRRSNDNATQDIGFSPIGDLDTAALKTFVGSNDGFVSIWYDQVGSHNLTSPGNSQQPRIVGAGVVDVTPIDGTIATNWGVNTSAVINGTNNIYMQSASGLSFAQGDSVFVVSNPFAGPGIVDKAAKPTAAADVIYFAAGAFQILAVDQQGRTPGSNCYSDDDNEPIRENNLTAGSGTFATNTPCKATYGGPNYQVNWHNFNSSNTQLQVGFQTSSTTGEAFGGYILEIIINGSGSYFIPSDDTALFANQQTYYHINTSFIADTVNEQLTAAYSTRRLRKGYTGPCMNVRRDFDNATQDIGFRSDGNIDTIGLINFVTGNGSHPTANGFVTTWYDQSCWANIFSTNAVQATNANQPQIVLNGAVITQGSNNRPVIWFNQNFNGTLILQSSAGSGASAGCWAGVIHRYTGTLPIPNTDFPTSVSNFTTSWQSVFQGAQNASFWQSNLAGAVNTNNTGSNTITGNLEQDIILAGTQNAIAFGNEPGGTNTGFIGYVGEFVSFIATLASGDQTVLYNNQKAWWGTP